LQHGVIEAHGRQNFAFDQALPLQLGFRFATGVRRVNDGVPDVKLAILTDVGLETHHVHVMYGLFSLADLKMKPHGLGPTPV
jgi:hypothetical protein